MEHPPTRPFRLIGQSPLALLAVFLAATMAPAPAAAKGELAKAILEDKVEKAWRLIEDRRGLDEPLDANGFTPVMIACEKGHSDMVRRLLDLGARIEARNAAGGTPLFIAAFHNRPDLVRLLLDRQAAPNVAADTGWTPLMAAAMHDAEGVGRLIDAGAEIDSRNEGGATALHVALAHGAGAAAALLLDNGASISAATNDGWTALMFAARFGDLEVARRLLAAGASVDRQSVAGASPLFLAAFAGHAELVRLLLDHGAEVNGRNVADGSSCLMVAAAHGHLDVVRLLIAAGADVNDRNTDGDNALFLAAVEGHGDVVTTLVEADAEILPSASEAEDSIATGLSYRAWAERLAALGSASAGARAYRSAADHFDSAARFFEQRSRAAKRKAFRKTLAGALQAVLASYDSQLRAKQVASLTALGTTARSGGSLASYYATVRSYERTQPLATRAGAVAEAESTEELAALRTAYARLAEESRSSAAACREEADLLSPTAAASEEHRAVPIGQRRGPEEQRQEDALLVLYRTQRIGFKVEPQVTIDGSALGRLVARKYSRHFVRPGTRTIRTTHSSLTLDLVAGKTYYFRGRLSARGGGGGGEIERIEEEVGAREVAKLTPVE